MIRVPAETRTTNGQSARKLTAARKILGVLPWAVFLTGLVLATGLLLSLIQEGNDPIDYRTYERAAEATVSEEPGALYLPAAESLRIWRSYHAVHTNMLDGIAPEAEPMPSPYPYPPTLALLVTQLDITATGFVVMVLLSVIGFGWLWLRSIGQGGVWLLLIVFSWDVMASFLGANVELVLLFLSLAAGALLWHGRSLLGAPLVALVVIAKPFYALLFVALGLLALTNVGSDVARTARRWILAAGTALALIGAEVVRWGPELRTQYLEYASQGLDHFWLVLPLAEQTPMSIWSRTPLQGLITAGVPAGTAQWLALLLWLLPLIFTIALLWRVRLSFPLAFALALVLLYWGRPIGWGFPYLELIVLSVLWPSSERWQRWVLSTIVLALMVSHWFALGLTLQGNGLQLFTLQNASFPWETWTVLPICWLLLVWHARVENRRSSRHQQSS